jgi:hypothetical protein
MSASKGMNQCKLCRVGVKGVCNFERHSEQSKDCATFIPVMRKENSKFWLSHLGMSLHGDDSRG